ncbi:hypothetical protein HAX54_022492 [Datura stramonium]|uniref:Uncharacterized protein n=1 Tax=Datura stramonium TaxID=4076 RepID=A0ABS8UUQ5_DATST|nr:hypothetical protein [Datura stramonium]
MIHWVNERHRTKPVCVESHDTAVVLRVEACDALDLLRYGLRDMEALGQSNLYIVGIGCLGYDPSVVW